MCVRDLLFFAAVASMLFCSLFRKPSTYHSPENTPYKLVVFSSSPRMIHTVEVLRERISQSTGDNLRNSLRFWVALFSAGDCFSPLASVTTETQTAEVNLINELTRTILGPAWLN